MAGALVHELEHAVAGWGAGHGADWKPGGRSASAYEDIDGRASGERREVDSTRKHSNRPLSRGVLLRSSSEEHPKAAVTGRVVEGVSTYPPKGDVFFVADIVEFRDGRIAREVRYYANPFEPPEWRSAWVEKA